MKIVEIYSHLNGLEYLKVHLPELWEEIEGVIGAVDAEACKTKKSKEFNFVTIDITSNNIGHIKGSLKVLNAYDDSLKNIINNIVYNPASFYITFTDNGLKNKVFEKFAAISELEVDAVKSKVNNAVYKRALNTDNSTKSNYTQLEKFLLSSNSISVKLNEQDNISLKDTLYSLDMSGYRKLLNSIKNLKVEMTAK